MCWSTSDLLRFICRFKAWPLLESSIHIPRNSRNPFKSLEIARDPFKPHETPLKSVKFRILISKGWHDKILFSRLRILIKLYSSRNFFINKRKLDKVFFFQLKLEAKLLRKNFTIYGIFFLMKSFRITHFKFLALMVTKTRAKVLLEFRDGTGVVSAHPPWENIVSKDTPEGPSHPQPSVIPRYSQRGLSTRSRGIQLFYYTISFEVL